VSDQFGQSGIRNGFFHDFKSKEILVKKWEPALELLVELKDRDEAETYQHGSPLY
jgi:hypothetical protein